MIKNEEETVLITSWDDCLAKVNKKLSLYKKDGLSPEEIPQVKLVTCIIQQLVTMSPSSIKFLFDRTRIMPEELLQKYNNLESKYQVCETERSNFEKQFIQIDKENKEFVQKYEAQDFECNKLKEEIIHLNIKIQEAGEVKHLENESMVDKFKKQVKKKRSKHT